MGEKSNQIRVISWCRIPSACSPPAPAPQKPPEPIPAHLTVSGVRWRSAHPSDTPESCQRDASWGGLCRDLDFFLPHFKGRWAPATVPPRSLTPGRSLWAATLSHFWPRGGVSDPVRVGGLALPTSEAPCLPPGTSVPAAPSNHALQLPHTGRMDGALETLGQPSSSLAVQTSSSTLGPPPPTGRS